MTTILSSLPVMSEATPGCARCETLPPTLSGPGVLHLQFPLSHSRGKLLKYLRAHTIPYTEAGELLSIETPEGDIAPFVLSLSEVFLAVEQADVRVLFQPQGQSMQLVDYFSVEPLDKFSAKTQSNWLISLIREQRLTAWFQPIIECQRRDHIMAYECLLRGQDNGTIIFPDRILPLARNAGLLFQLDRAARLTAIREAAKFGIATRIFINFTPTAIYDPINCLSSTVRTINELGIRHDQVVFEVIESEYVRDFDHLNKILDYYRDGGFQVALDDVGAGYSNLSLLSRLQPDFIKLDRDLITNVHQDAYKATIARKLLEIAQELGIKTITEGIETEEEYAWVREHGADWAQGYLFARPASPPPSVSASLLLG